MLSAKISVTDKVRTVLRKAFFAPRTIAPIYTFFSR
jgi:hypothetical protein